MGRRALPFKIEVGMTETVAIITPCYKAERWIGTAVRSVLAQTYPHWEHWIVSDDGADYEAMLAAPETFSDTDTGTGSSGFLFRLDAAQQTTVLPLFTSLADTNNRVGAGMAVSDAQGGPETLFVVNTDDLTAIPEPASLLLTGTGLLGLAGLVLRRRRSSNREQ